MTPIREKIPFLVLSLLLLITTVLAQETSIILDGDKTFAISGDILVFLTIGLIVFVIFIIIKILTIGVPE